MNLSLISNVIFFSNWNTVIFAISYDCKNFRSHIKNEVPSQPVPLSYRRMFPKYLDSKVEQKVYTHT